MLQKLKLIAAHNLEMKMIKEEQKEVEAAWIVFKIKNPDGSIEYRLEDFNSHGSQTPNHTP